MSKTLNKGRYFKLKNSFFVLLFLFLVALSFGVVSKTVILNPQNISKHFCSYTFVNGVHEDDLSIESGLKDIEFDSLINYNVVLNA